MYVHLKCLKLIFDSRGTSTFLLYGETGRYPIHVYRFYINFNIKKNYILSKIAQKPRKQNCKYCADICTQNIYMES